VNVECEYFIVKDDAVKLINCRWIVLQSLVN